MHTLHAHSRPQLADNVTDKLLFEAAAAAAAGSGCGTTRSSSRTGQHPAVCCRDWKTCTAGGAGTDADCGTERAPDSIKQAPTLPHEQAVLQGQQAGSARGCVQPVPVPGRQCRGSRQCLCLAGTAGQSWLLVDLVNKADGMLGQVAIAARRQCASDTISRCLVVVCASAWCWQHVLDSFATCNRVACLSCCVLLHRPSPAGRRTTSSLDVAVAAVVRQLCTQ
jgi:hypothetical protein